MFAGVDIGGTFTDLVSWDGERLRIHKLPSTPSSPERAFFDGLEGGGMLDSGHVVHGSTVAVNALLERKGARTAFITTAGFEDMLAIGRQVRPRLYDLMVEKDPPLIPAELCFGARERTGPGGEVLVPLDPDHARELADLVARRGVEAVAVCLLFSFARPEHERMLARELARHGVRVHLSSRILPEYREYERACTVAVNAYVSRAVEGYLSRLREGLPRRTALEVMHSGGGTMSVAEAVEIPARTLMSGPAGGVVASARVARASGHAGIISYDMGGTSTDVSLVSGSVALTSEGEVGGFPVRFPMVDIHSIGAGGGSIARVDAGGALKVGPESAGADPGPACYGKGILPTVTDANVVLGRLLEDDFLGGRMRLYPDRAREAVSGLARELGWGLREAAAGVLAVALAHMASAVRVISVEKGHDPADYLLVAFGGAGPMHCCELAELMAMGSVLVPPCPGTFSALGLLLADRVRDASRTLMLPLGDGALREAADALEELRGEIAAAWGSGAREAVFEPALDMRYRGQSYELTVGLSQSGWRVDRLRESFEAAHLDRYGYRLDGASLELVNVRLRARVPSTVPVPGSDPSRGAGRASGVARAVFGVVRGGLREERCALIQRGDLGKGDSFSGPCLILEEDATTVVPPGWRGEVDARANILLLRTDHGSRER
ncbi:MAG: hydantoinase/oxoprolinase family protein [Actinobacteria bacterium]|nr:hydantoinase/oxoprolinase family protein [Actinomycetota bacterium]